MTTNEAIGRLLHLWGMYKKVDPQMGQALHMAIQTLSGPGEHERLRTYLEAVKGALAGKVSRGTILERICPGCDTRNKLAEAALAGELVDAIDEICPPDEAVARGDPDDP